jgi:hypothetical protein
MNAGDGFREGLTLFVSHERETFVFALQMLALCGLSSAIIVLAQNRMMTGIDRVRSDRVFAQVVAQWCIACEAARGGRFADAVRHLGTGVLFWFQWKSLTPVGRLDTTLITCVAMVCTAFLGAESLDALLRILELLKQ